MYLDESFLRDGGILSVVHYGRKALWKVAGHNRSAVLKQRKRNAGSLFPFFFLLNLELHSWNDTIYNLCTSDNLI